VYVDTATDQPAFVVVRIGMIGRHRLAASLSSLSVRSVRSHSAMPARMVA